MLLMIRVYLFVRSQGEARHPPGACLAGPLLRSGPDYGVALMIVEDNPREDQGLLVMTQVGKLWEWKKTLGGDLQRHITRVSGQTSCLSSLLHRRSSSYGSRCRNSPPPARDKKAVPVIQWPIGHRDGDMVTKPEVLIVLESGIESTALSCLTYVPVMASNSYPAIQAHDAGALDIERTDTQLAIQIRYLIVSCLLSESSSRKTRTGDFAAHPNRIREDPWTTRDL